MSRAKRLQAIASACCVALSVATAASHAATIAVQDSVDDYEAQRRSSAGSGGVPPAGTYIASENFGSGSRVGFQSGFLQTGTTPGGITSIFFFQLPALAPGETISSATFSVAILAEPTTGVQPTFNGDLYALGVTNSITKSATEAENLYYVGGDQGSNVQNTGLNGTRVKIQDNFLVPTEWVAAGGTPAAPQTADLTSYVQNLYANPGANGFTPGTSYLVMRINGDSGPSSGTQRYNLAFQGTGPSGNGGAGTAEERPLITLQTVVPEPASLALLGLGGVAVLTRRRG